MRSVTEVLLPRCKWLDAAAFVVPVGAQREREQRRGPAASDGRYSVGS